MKPHTHKGLVVALVLAGPWPGSCCPGSRHFRSSGPRAYGDTFQVKIVAGVVVRLDTPLFSQALAAFSSPSSTTVFFDWRCCSILLLCGPFLLLCHRPAVRLRVCVSTLRLCHRTASKTSNFFSPQTLLLCWWQI